MLQPTARPLPRPILGLAVSESEMGFAATEGPLRAEQGVSPVTSVVVQKVNRKRSLGIVKVGNNKLFAHWPTSLTYINLGVVVLVRTVTRTSHGKIFQVIVLVQYHKVYFNSSFRNLHLILSTIVCWATFNSWGSCPSRTDCSTFRSLPGLLGVVCLPLPNCLQI